MKVADKWFEWKKIDDDVTYMWEPHVTKFARCNIWHVKGRDKDLLIDSGFALAPLKDAMEEVTQNPISHIATHFHADHVGGFYEFEERLIHKAEAHRMESFWEETAVLGYREMVNVFNKMDPTWWKDYLSTYGMSEEEFNEKAPEYLITAVPSEGYDPDKFQIPSCSASSTVEHGDVIDLGDRAFEVIHMPGHSEGAIGLWEKETGIFFSGDIVYDTLFIDFLPESDKETYVESCKKLLDLPVRVVHCGHSVSFGRDRFQELLKDYIVCTEGGRHSTLERLDKEFF